MPGRVPKGAVSHVLASTMDMNVLLGVTSLSCLVVFNGVSSGLLLHSAADEARGGRGCTRRQRRALRVARGY